MQLQEIYKPIRPELREVEKVLEASLSDAKNKSLLKVNRFLLESPGKRIRPALVILCAKANPRQAVSENKRALIEIASAIELIHTASLIHDDVIDHSDLRHNKPTVNSRWGKDVSITLGDYLYSLAFKLISQCPNKDILVCISSATKAMCEGELIQVVERDNLSLLKERYIMIVKKKTASLFAASCQAGAILSNSPRPLQSALRQYGMNFGIAFQIIDDYSDLMAGRQVLGKLPGQDIAVGEMTLPLLNLMRSVDKEKRSRLTQLLRSKNQESFRKIKLELIRSRARQESRRIIFNYMDLAKEKLKALADTEYRKCLSALGDFILKRGFS
jgi:octaprenyl-diphosphate synthase